MKSFQNFLSEYFISYKPQNGEITNIRLVDSNLSRDKWIEFSELLEGYFAGVDNNENKCWIVSKDPNLKNYGINNNKFATIVQFQNIEDEGDSTTVVFDYINIPAINMWNIAPKEVKQQKQIPIEIENNE